MCYLLCAFSERLLSIFFLTLYRNVKLEGDEQHNIIFYYPPEVRRWEYVGLEVFLLQYFPLVKV